VLHGRKQVVAILICITKYSTLGYLNGKGSQDISFSIKLLAKKFSAARYQKESH